jgi:hypothetical protein
MDQQVRDTFQPIFWGVKNDLKHKIKKMMGYGLCLKHNLQKAHSESKPREVKHIFTK